MSPLKCPFCESKALSVGYSFSLAGKKRYVSCICGAQGPKKRTKGEAIDAWNSRCRFVMYDPATLTNPEEARRTAAYIYNFEHDGFKPELIAMPKQKVSK